ncbi:SKOR, partial [Symbiodinium sp. CCMP2456]
VVASPPTSSQGSRPGRKASEEGETDPTGSLPVETLTAKDEEDEAEKEEMMVQKIKSDPRFKLPPLKSILKKPPVEEEEEGTKTKLGLRAAAMAASTFARRRANVGLMDFPGLIEPLKAAAAKKVIIVDSQEEMRERRRSQKEEEWKERQQHLQSKRRLKMLVEIIFMPIALVHWICRCYLASPRARQVWLVTTLAVCLFELWSSAMFIAFVLDSTKAEFLYTLLSIDHYSNVLFIIDAILRALDKIRGPMDNGPDDIAPTDDDPRKGMAQAQL